MSERSVRGSASASSVTISFGERYLASDRFQAIYREGMDLVESTARYLDGEGRQEGKALKGATNLSFASESMRLTTRLMNIASWLLIRRSVNNGEMTQERARRERLKLRIDSIGRLSHIKGHEELPARLKLLIEASFALQDKVIKLDRLFEGGSVLGDEASHQAERPTGVMPAYEPVSAKAKSARLRLVFDADRTAKH
jgi:regulator of CtrA degradation